MVGVNELNPVVTLIRLPSKFSMIDFDSGFER